MCVGAGDTLSAGARSALADMRGPGVPPGLGGGTDAHLHTVRTVYEFVLYMLMLRHQANQCCTTAQSCAKQVVLCYILILSVGDPFILCVFLFQCFQV